MATNADKRNRVISAWQQTSFSAPQALVFIIPSIASVVLATWYYINHHSQLGIRLPPFASPGDRIAYTLKLQFFPAATLALAIHWVWGHRVAYPLTRNPLSGHEYYVEKASRILQNTVEQLALHFLNILTFTVVAPEKHLFMIPFFVFAFTIGRIAFGIGYTIHPKYRIPGFVWTFLPNMGLFFYNATKVLA